jgi:hypothetical protein
MSKSKTRVVATHHPENLRLSSLLATLTTLIPDTIVWNQNNKPAFDMFEELKPDIFVCSSVDFNKYDLVLALQEHPNTSLIVHGLQYPEQLSPQLLCLTQDIPEQILSNVSVPYLKIPYAANVAQYHHHIIDDQYNSDILYISHILNEQVISCLQALPALGKCKFCGPTTLPLVNYIGTASFPTLASMLHSTKIVIDFDGTMMWNAAWKKTFCLSNIENPLYPTFTSADELVSLVKHYVDDEHHRNTHVRKAHKLAKENTYFHVLSQFFERQNNQGLADMALMKLQEIIS